MVFRDENGVDGEGLYVGVASWRPDDELDDTGCDGRLAG
jgi:hypothetical protein